MTPTRFCLKDLGVVVAGLMFVCGSLGAAQRTTDRCAALAEIAGMAPEELAAQWKETYESLKATEAAFAESKSFVELMGSAFLADEFVWLNGNPGGGKSAMARTMLAQELKGLALKMKESDLKTFFVQFHKLMDAGVITGFRDVKKALDSGEYEIQTQDSMVHRKFVLLLADEVEKAPPHVLTKFLSVLNERKALLGTQVVEAGLRAGVFTSNKTQGEFMEAFGVDDQPAGEALLDRLSFKAHVPNRIQDQRAMVDLIMRRQKTAQGKTGESQEPLTTHFSNLGFLATQVRLTPAAHSAMDRIVAEMDAYYTNLKDTILNERRNMEGEGAPRSNFFPPNQFSNRSLMKLLKTTKAKFIVDQMSRGVVLEDLRFEMGVEDLVHLQAGALLGSLGRVAPKTVPVELNVNDTFSSVQTLGARWDPRNRILSFKRKGAVYSLKLDDKFQPIEDGHGLEFASSLEPLLTKAQSDHGYDGTVARFESDGELEEYLKRADLIPEGALTELNQVVEMRAHFVKLLDAEIARGEATKNPTSKRKVATSTEEKRVTPAAGGLQRDFEQSAAWLATLRDQFPGSEHLVSSLVSGVLNRSNIYVFGPPGGAKSLLTNVILDSELASRNAQKGSDENPETKFVHQFSKQDDPAIITGHLDIQRLTTGDGRYQFRREGSLAKEDQPFAVFDELEKGGTGVKAALLAPLAEREAMLGSQVFKIPLEMAVTTSNKTPGEFLDGLFDDRPTGLALLSRHGTKVFVGNKFVNEGEQREFLARADAGTLGDHGKALEGHTLSLTPLRELVENMELERAYVDIAQSVFTEFSARALAQETATKKAFELRESPNYYERASDGSTRAALRAMADWRGHVVTDALMSGVPFDQLPNKLDLRHLGSFARSLIYQGPYEIKQGYDKEGLIVFTLEDAELKEMKVSPRYDERTRFMLESMEFEARNYVEVLNQTIRDFQVTHRDVIAKFPNLFPELFVSREAREAWVKKQ